MGPNYRLIFQLRWERKYTILCCVRYTKADLASSPSSEVPNAFFLSSIAAKIGLLMRLSNIHCSADSSSMRWDLAWKWRQVGGRRVEQHFLVECFFPPAMGPWWDRARADKLFTVIIISRPYYGLVSLHFFSVAVVSKIQRNTATNFQRKTGNIWCSNISTYCWGATKKTSTSCVICGSNFNPRFWKL